MKKVLLGTTALAVAGMVAGGAANAAEEPITAGIGGYYKAAMAFLSEDNDAGQFADNRNSHALGQDIEIGISGSTTLDNGMTVGFVANIEGNGGTGTGSAALDERWLFFRGGFGQFRIGTTESARQEMTNFAPNGAWNFGVNTPFFIFANPGNATFFNVRTYDDGLGNEDNMKVIYFSPTFNGFRIGASYAPDDNNQQQYGGNTTDVVGALQNNASISAEFAHDFGSVNIRLMAGYEQYVVETCNAAANVQTCEDDPASTQFGGTLNFGEWSIGGGWLETEQIALAASGAGRDRTDYDLGISYWSGPIGVGLQWGHAEIDVADGTQDELDIYALNATYVIGPGIDVEAQIDMGEFDDGTTGENLDNDWTSLLIGTSVSF
jgi:hypothetical protein